MGMIILTTMGTSIATTTMGTVTATDMGTARDMTITATIITMTCAEPASAS